MPAPDPYAEFMNLVTGYRISQAIHVAATLGIADLLKDGPSTSDSLAAATNAHPRALYRLMRALAAVGVFHEDTGKRFSLTPTGELLRSDAPRPAAPYAILVGRPHIWQAWGHLLHSVRTGENAFRHVHGVNLWNYQSRHPEEAAFFAQGMTGLSQGIANEVIAAYDFSPFACVVDVGGGEGTQLAALLSTYPLMRGILFDQPEVVKRAKSVLAAAGVDGRCEVTGGTFFEAVPSGGDAYVMKYILHDWDDEDSIAILKVCRRACEPHGKLLVLERVVAPPNEGRETKIVDLHMLVSPGGEERSREEFAALFASAGFRLERVIEASERLCVIEGVPA